MQANCLGIEIGGTKLQIVVGDAKANICQRRRFAVDRQQGGAGIRRQVEVALPELLRTFQPQAIAVGFGGPVDGQSGRIARSHQIEGWSDFTLRDWLTELTHRPVLVENDANAGALGEAVRGAGAGFNPVFYVTLGSGVGGGLVVGGDGGVEVLRLGGGREDSEAERERIRLPALPSGQPLPGRRSPASRAGVARR